MAQGNNAPAVGLVLLLLLNLSSWWLTTQHCWGGRALPHKKKGALSFSGLGFLQSHTDKSKVRKTKKKELVKRYVLSWFKLTTPLQVWGSFAIFWVDPQTRVQGTWEQRIPAGAGSCEITEKGKEQLVLSQCNNQPGCWHRDCCDPEAIIFLMSQNPNLCCLPTVSQHPVCATSRSLSCTGGHFFLFPRGDFYM